MKERGLISGSCHFVLVLLFEFVVGQRRLDGVLGEHWRKIQNSTVRQGLDMNRTVLQPDARLMTRYKNALCVVKY